MSQPATTEVAPGTRVFVGNLSFRTTDQDLQNLFKDCGNIKSAVIVTRGRRSLGYGFVDFGEVKDASAAVDSMNQKDFSGRPLKVELALPPKERSETEGTEEKPKRERKPRAPKTETLQAASSTSQGDGPAQKRVAKRKPRRKGKAAQPVEGAAPVTPAATGEAPATTKRKRKPRTKKPVDPANPPAPKEVVKREKILSKTTLFVANLPFSVTDEELAKIFEGCQSAHVVKTRSNRSRGYGFVVFENEAQQLEALEKKNGHLVPAEKGEPRAIALSISSSVASSPETASAPAAETKS